jgi:FOG: HEAT repeat
MKRILIPLLIIVITLLGAVSGFSAEKKATRSSLSDNSIESLLIGVETDNIGLKSSSASILGEFKTTKAVIPLMRELKNNSDERIRIQAAIALWKIGDPRGIYTIKKAISFDSSERVKRICYILYLDTVDSSKTRF